jgi:hypothetical protein
MQGLWSFRLDFLLLCLNRRLNQWIKSSLMTPSGSISVFQQAVLTVGALF